MDDECDSHEPEYEIEIFDVYWKKKYNRLIKYGMDKDIARRTIIEADRERSNQIAYR